MPKFKPRRINRSSLSVRLAFFNMDFDTAKEWVKAYRELDDPRDKIKALEKAMEFVYPKMNAVAAEDVKVIEMALDEGEDLIQSRDDSFLLEVLERGKSLPSSNYSGTVEEGEPLLEEARRPKGDPDGD